MPETRGVVIGIDGGGTATASIAVDERGMLIGSGQSGPSNPHNVGTATAVVAIKTAMQSAIGELTHCRLQAICIGLAGVTTSAIKDEIQSELFIQVPAIAQSKLLITHDLEIAHCAAFGDAGGIALIAGTGSSCFAKDRNGRAYRVSGRSDRRDDPGSGFDMGSRALYLGKIQSTMTRAEIAQRASQVLADAEQGRPEAISIVGDCAKGLVGLLEELAATTPLDFSDTKLALFGGLLEGSDYYRKCVLSLIQEALPPLAIAQKKRPPQVGALKMAWQLISDQPLPLFNGA